MLQLFASCNVTVGGGLFAARSTNGGLTWTYPDPTDKTLADGDAGQGPLACCDPTLTWDSFGNLFFAYLDSSAANVVVLLSTNGGASFTTLAPSPEASISRRSSPRTRARPARPSRSGWSGTRAGRCARAARR